MLKSKIYRWGATLVCLLGIVHGVQARPGESRSTLERRLLDGRIAVKFPDREIDAKLEDRGVPYKNLFEFFPEGLEHEIYFKPAGAEKASQGDIETKSPEGWELHVIYYKGQSVFEAYRRNGGGISRFEQEGLMMLNKGQSFWKRVDKNQIKDSAIGYDFERDDGELRAARRGNYFIIFLPEFDNMLFAKMEEERQLADEDAKEKAPQSLAGF